jgi:hypothetical protein
MREGSSPGLFLGRSQEFYAAGQQSVVRGLHVIDLKRNRNETPNEGDGFSIRRVHAFEGEVGFSSIELSPTHIAPANAPAISNASNTTRGIVPSRSRQGVSHVPGLLLTISPTGQHGIRPNVRI